MHVYEFSLNNSLACTLQGTLSNSNYLLKAYIHTILWHSVLARKEGDKVNILPNLFNM